MFAMRKVALIVGVAASLLSIIGLFIDRTQFFRSYLTAYNFWLALGLGSLSVLMVHHTTGGGWGLLLRRALEASTRTLPLLAGLFIPIVFGLKLVYLWARPEFVERDHLLQQKAVYLNAPFFVARAVLYFAIWLTLAYFLNRWSAEQDEGIAHRPFRRFSAFGLIISGMAITFAAVDWIMSLEPHWFSTIFGVLFAGSQALAAFSLAVLVVMLLSRRPPLSEVLTPLVLKDLGNLMLAFLMIWAYLSFSQLLIIWSGNLPEEIPWYLHRSRGGWQWIAAAMALLYFGVPFLLLLFSEIKRHPHLLVRVAAFLLAMSAVANYWLVMPSFFQRQFHFHLLDITVWLGIGGLWVALFLRELEARPLFPRNIPNLEQVLELA